MTRTDAPEYPPEFKPPKPTAARIAQYASFLVAAALAVGLVLVGLPVIGGWWTGCGGELVSQRGECVGVTDLTDLDDDPNSFHFDRSLERVEKLIRNENLRLEGESAVTVGLLMPMSKGDGSSQSEQQIRAHVEGAYLAQHLANRDENAAPKIRLVLANEGGTEHAWSGVTSDLIEMKDDEQPLVAVTGMGVSVRETVWGARALWGDDPLSGPRIPMIGSVITADELNKVGGQPPEPNERIPGIPGLSRVSVSNDTEATALASAPRLQSIRPLIVHDTNANDFYTAGLRRDFEKHFARQWREAENPHEPYDGQGSGVSSRFSAIARTLCGVNPPDTVLYSGRAVLLPGFIDELRNDTQCKNPITVVTGSDGSTLQDTLKPTIPGQREVRVVYAALADQSVLQDQNFTSEFTRWFEKDDLNNAWAIMAHDAVKTAITAIRGATDQSGDLPPISDVVDQLGNLNSGMKWVDGAAGRFEINAKTGDPVGRTVPIMEIGPYSDPSEPGKLRAEMIHQYRQPNPRCPDEAPQC